MVFAFELVPAEIKSGRLSSLVGVFLLRLLVEPPPCIGALITIPQMLKLIWAEDAQAAIKAPDQLG
jgi:hypothetical protein